MKIATFAAASATAIASVHAKVFFQEDFNDGDISNWVNSNREGLGKFELSSGMYSKDEEDLGLQTSEDAKFYGIASKFPESYDNTDDTLVVQLSVKHEQDIDCGGGYVKVYGPDVELASLDGDSPYNIMFGPDICGSKKMVHVIFSNKGENYLIKKTIRPPTDVFSHAYTLIVNSDNTYKVLIDNEEAESGSIDEDWDILEPKKIQDPEASKPEDWVNDDMMVDPEDKKPDNYDDIPEKIVDAEAAQPEDWDDEFDGEWQAPMVDNPEFMGEWTPKMIKNPDYKGPWEHPLVDNPEFKEDATLYAFNSGAIGVDVWQVKSGSIFDDILVTNDVEAAEAAAAAVIERAAAEKVAKKEVDDKKEAERQEAAAKDAEQQGDFKEEEDDLDEDEHEEL